MKRKSPRNTGAGGGNAEGEPLQKNAALPDPPDAATVLLETVLVSPKGKRYRVMRTNQTDESVASLDAGPEANRTL